MLSITITLDEPEIKQAIIDRIIKTGVISANAADIEVNMVAGRGANGHSAVIEVKQSNILASEGSVIPVVTPKEVVPPVTKKAEKADPVSTAIPEPIPIPEPETATPTKTTTDLFADDPSADPGAIGSDEDGSETVMPPPVDPGTANSLFN